MAARLRTSSGYCKCSSDQPPRFWNADYEGLQREQGASSHVFMTERDGPMTPKAFHALFGRIGARAKMQFPIHPHMLRHGCGYALANAGHDSGPCAISLPLGKAAWDDHRRRQAETLAFLNQSAEQPVEHPAPLTAEAALDQAGQEFGAVC
jgi:hypothetical protein